MKPKIVEISDLRKPDDGSDHIWESTGDDPAFLITFSCFRDRYVLVSIEALDGNIDPRIYLNEGVGFREANSIALSSGQAFLITADIGHYGSICSFRVDPASFDTRFRFRVQSFSSAQAMQNCIERETSTNISYQQIALGQIPRFWKTFSRIFKSKRRRSQVERYAEANYRLASKTPNINSMHLSGIWISVIVPVYNAPPRYLDDLLRSFESQNDKSAQLILSDDGSTSPETQRWFQSQKHRENVLLIVNGSNGGIAAATNTGMRAAKGTWIAFLDHDDVIAPYALKMMRQALEQNPTAEFLYSDELIVDDNLRITGALLKPAYDPILLDGVNYINHFSVYRRSRLEEINYLREGFDGSQDYDLLLRYLEGISQEYILHLPYPAYWWRRNGKTFSCTFLDKATENARRALDERFTRMGQQAYAGPALTDTLHRITFSAPPQGWPKISVIIPNRNSYALLSQILGDLFQKTDYPDMEVLIIDNGSTDEDVVALYERYASERADFSFHISDEEFNFSRAVNKGITLATGEHFLLLNNDIEVIEPGWLKEMVSCLAYEKTGIVGAKLLYPNNKVQHAGVIAGFGGLAGHWYLNKSANYGGPMNRLHVRNSMTCVTAAAMLISGDCARSIGEWDEENFVIAYNDVDYCLRAFKMGFRTIWTPFACLYHHESASRGSDMEGEKRKRFEREKNNLRRIHQTGDFSDPVLNPAYSRNKSDPDLVAPSSIAMARTFWPAT
ncbi:glycosyltransferase family 2 protein [Rhizobium sp. PL01]|uniref:glycosyltransferase family 2 protein n=1 Tax=Rhizobium sp. PL01 TaxID=3085631 RepID=UPI0029822C6C|nr:glycosyltransferase family 2 protein [Rhizobium sp. PL01]MDW5315994.1 glycosyltransferase family 2 protein [Rhizobium sp. PL01]